MKYFDKFKALPMGEKVIVGAVVFAVFLVLVWGGVETFGLND